MKLNELNNGQIAYKDSEGNLMVLPMTDDKVRDAFIRRLMLEYVEEKDVEELLASFKQAGRDIVEENTESVEEVKQAIEDDSE